MAEKGNSGRCALWLTGDWFGFDCVRQERALPLSEASGSVLFFMRYSAASVSDEKPVRQTGTGDRAESFRNGHSLLLAYGNECISARCVSSMPALERFSTT